MPKEEGLIELGLQEKQGLAFQCPATELLYGGAAGGGKSHLMRVAAILWAARIPGLQIGLFRRAYPDLIANHLEGATSFWAMLAPWIQSGHARIVQSKARIHFWNGSTIRLCHLNTKKDLAKYQGSEFHFLLFDELTHFTEDEYTFLRGRLRMTGIDLPEEYRHLFPRIMSGTNPGSLGHLWVKRTFVDQGEFKLHRAKKAKGGMLQCYIPARLDDNPILKESDPDYGERLEGLGNPALVKALRDGNWRIVAGAMFGETWDDDEHTCDPFSIPPDWKLWRGGDDGWAAPSVVVWLTQDPVTKTYYAIDELVRVKTEPEKLAEQTKEKDLEISIVTPGVANAYNQKPLKGFYDSSAFASKGEGSTTRGKQMNALGTKWEEVPKWPGSRADGAKNLHRLLKPNPNDPTGGPGIRFFRGKCPTLIETIPALPADPNNLEAVDSDSEDHAYDALRYGLQFKSKKRGTTRVGGL